MALLFAPQILRQRAAGSLARNGCRRRCRFTLRSLWLGRGLFGFGVFQLQFQLLNLFVELLRLPAELHALQLEDEQFQVLILGALRLQLRVEREHQILQRGVV